MVRAGIVLGRKNRPVLPYLSLATSTGDETRPVSPVNIAKATRRVRSGGPDRPEKGAAAAPANRAQPGPVLLHPSLERGHNAWLVTSRSQSPSHCGV